MKNSDKTAMPFVIYDANGNSQFDTGLTKREYFAVMAMQGELASQDSDGFYKHDDNSLKDLAEKSVDAAEALLKALEK